VGLGVNPNCGGPHNLSLQSACLSVYHSILADLCTTGPRKVGVYHEL
jgi:hypothetical protein